MGDLNEKKAKNELIDLSMIRRLCVEKHISLAELARRIGLDERQKMNARLNNQNSISGDELILIAEHLGVAVEDLRLS